MQDVNKRNSLIAKWAVTLSGPILAIVSFVAGVYFDPLKFGEQQPIAALPAFLFSIIILIITQNLNTNFELKRASIYSDRVYEAVKDYLHVTKIGSPEKAMEYVNSRIPVLREVKNTSFNIEGSLEKATDKLYDLDTYSNTKKLISYYTTQGLIWYEIVDSFGIDRCRYIHNTSSSIANKGKSKYKYVTISHIEPQMNFIILQYTDGTEEVLFNWDFRGTGKDPVVLISRDEQIINMFSIHYEYLWRAGAKDHDNIDIK